MRSGLGSLPGSRGLWCEGAPLARSGRGFSISTRPAQFFESDTSRGLRVHAGPVLGNPSFGIALGGKGADPCRLAVRDADLYPERPVIEREDAIFRFGVRVRSRVCARHKSVNAWRAGTATDLILARGAGDRAARPRDRKPQLKPRPFVDQTPDLHASAKSLSGCR